MNGHGRRLTVVGGGWAGLAAAVQGVQTGWQVRLVEMAGQLGGRARSGAAADGLYDNGQHILIGAYRQTLALMRTVGVDLEDALLRRPLSLVYPDGHGLRLPPGPAWLALARGVLGHRAWGWRDKAALLAAAGGWWADSFQCPASLTVSALCASLPAALRRDLIDPLCVAALNTPADRASAAVFLVVLRDALFAGAGGADLLLPRQPLSRLLPDPAGAWLRRQGATVCLGHRVRALSRDGHRWRVDGQAADAVVLACTARQAAQLAAPHAPSWAAQAAALPVEPIITAWLHDPRLHLTTPMLALHDGPEAPAQFVFDLGQLGQEAGLFAFVVSGAAPWCDRGLPATAQAVQQQAQACWPGHFQGSDAVRHLAAERRATFACTPDLVRPPAHIADGLVAAGDHVADPYPATLEGAVRAGQQAVAALNAAVTR